MKKAAPLPAIRGRKRGFFSLVQIVWFLFSLKGEGWLEKDRDQLKPLPNWPIKCILVIVGRGEPLHRISGN
jgi:hypothetical protein